MNSFHNPDLIFRQPVKLVDHFVNKSVSLADLLSKRPEFAHRFLEFVFK